MSPAFKPLGVWKQTIAGRKVEAMIKLRIGRFGGFDIAKPTVLELAGLALVLLFVVLVLVFSR